MNNKKLKTFLKILLSFFISVLFICQPWRNIENTNGEVESVTVKPWFFKGGSLRPQRGGNSLRLWPDETKGDRILNQLMFIPEEEPLTKKKIYVTKLQNLKFQSGSNIFHDLNCPVKKCEVVLDQTIADAVIFENFVTKIREASVNQIWILHSLESPLFSGKVIQETSVNWTASYRLDSDLVTPYDKWVYYDENKKTNLLQKNYASGKTKKVVWFVSNCHSKNKRLEYAKILGKYISVDIYGACGDKVCLKQFGDYCREIVSKNYKFYLSFENANCRDYITEKFFRNALRLDVIPIVMGAPKEDYEKVAPKNSYIHIEDFSSPKHLAEYLHYLDRNDENYNSYFLWKGAGEFINTYFLCRLCGMLHSKRSNYFYKNINNWWRGHKICTKSFWNSTNKNKISKFLQNYINI